MLLLLHHWLPLLLLHWCYCHITGRYTGPLRLMDFNYLFSLSLWMLLSTLELMVLTSMLLLEELGTTTSLRHTTGLWRRRLTGGAEWNGQSDYYCYYYLFLSMSVVGIMIPGGVLKWDPPFWY